MKNIGFVSYLKQYFTAVKDQYFAYGLSTAILLLFNKNKLASIRRFVTPGRSLPHERYLIPLLSKKNTYMCRVNMVKIKR